MSTPILINRAAPVGETDAVAFTTTALEAGFAGVGFVDSPRLFADPMIETTRVLTNCPTALAGRCVLSLPMLHVSKAASMFRTLAQHAPTRLVAAVGRGESSLINEGLTPPPLRAYAAMLAALNRSLDDVRPELTLLGAASGPKTVAATARTLGGILLDVGVDPSSLRTAIDHARQANPDVRIWAFVRGTVTEDPALARQDFTALLGSCARRMATAPEFYGLSPDTTASVARLASAHDYAKHGQTDASDPASREGDPELAEAADLVQQHFLAAGSVAEIGHRLGDLASAGLDGLVLAGGLPRTSEQLPALGCAAAMLGTSDR